MTHTQAPDLLPVLSAGKHRNPRKGACFMEFASYLAGEKWSDQPKCTHELLAGLARLVNDNVRDGTRAQLVEMIPRVVGLNTDDLRVYPILSIRAASVAVPVAPRAHQRALAVGMLAAERFLIELDGAVSDEMRALMDESFDSAPDAFEWARGFRRGVTTSTKLFTRRAAPRVVLNAVDGIVRSADPDMDTLLKGLLESAIADCEAICARDELSADTSRTGSLSPAS